MGHWVIAGDPLPALVHTGDKWILTTRATNFVAAVSLEYRPCPSVVNNPHKLFQYQRFSPRMSTGLPRHFPQFVQVSATSLDSVRWSSEQDGRAARLDAVDVDVDGPSAGPPAQTDNEPRYNRRQNENGPDSERNGHDVLVGLAEFQRRHRL